MSADVSCRALVSLGHAEGSGKASRYQSPCVEDAFITLLSDAIILQNKHAYSIRRHSYASRKRHSSSVLSQKPQACDAFSTRLAELGFDGNIRAVSDKIELRESLVNQR